MNIAYVVPEFVTEVKGGGLASYINNISQILADLGHNITIIVKSKEDGTINWRNNIKVIRVSVSLDNVDENVPGSIYREWSRVLNERLIEEHNQGGNFDVVQYANWNAFAFERTAIPTVVRISSDLPLWRAANRIDYDVNAEYDCIKVTDYMEDIALINADEVFGPSELIANIISQRTGKAIKVIESPFYQRKIQSDESVFKQTLLGKRYILSHGMLNLLKGTKLIADNIYDILNFDKTINYVFAGKDCGWKDENEDIINAIDYIKKMAKEHADRIIYLGTLSREQLYPVINNSLFCVLPSRIDNLPNTCIEAMSFGKIVLGTRGSSFEQLITDGENGFLIDRENGNQLVEKIKEILKLSNAKREEVEACAKLRIEKMEPEVVAAQVLQLYRNTLDKKRDFGNEVYYKGLIEKYNNEVGLYSKEYMLSK